MAFIRPALRKTFSSLIIGLALIMAGCSAAPDSDLTAGFAQTVTVAGAGSYIDISPEELHQMTESQEFFFVNVHIPYEGEIPGTNAFIPYDQVESALDQFPQQTDATIVLYCRSGSMSTTAARALVERGYTEVFNLDGGFRAWESQGLPFMR